MRSFVAISGLMCLLSGCPSTPTPTAPPSVPEAKGAKQTHSISWDAVTQNTDGSPVAAPVTYNVYETRPHPRLIASGIRGLVYPLSTQLGVCWQASTTDAHGTESTRSKEVCLQ